MARKEPAVWVKAREVGRRTGEVRRIAHARGLRLVLVNASESYTEPRRYLVVTEKTFEVVAGDCGLDVDELEQYLADCGELA